MTKAAGTNAVVDNIKISDAARQKNYAEPGIRVAGGRNPSAVSERQRIRLRRLLCTHLCYGGNEIGMGPNERPANLAKHGIAFDEAIKGYGTVLNLIVPSSQARHSESDFLR
jgi:hypothetical protein